MVELKPVVATQTVLWKLDDKQLKLCLQGYEGTLVEHRVTEEIKRRIMRKENFMENLIDSL